MIGDPVAANLNSPRRIGATHRKTSLHLTAKKGKELRMTTTVRVIFCWGLAVLLAAPAWGQEIGDRLRIKVKKANSRPVVGNLVAIDESKLVLKRRRRLGGDQITIPRTSIKQISRSLGTPKRSGVTGFTIGLGIGVMGVLAGASVINITTCSLGIGCEGPSAAELAEGLFVYGLTYACIGWLIDAQMLRLLNPEKWELIELGEKAQVGLAPMFHLAAREGGVGATIGFRMQFP